MVCVSSVYRDSEENFIGICDDYAMFFDLTVFLHEVVINPTAHHSEISTPSAGGMELLMRASSVRASRTPSYPRKFLHFAPELESDELSSCRRQLTAER